VTPKNVYAKYACRYHAVNTLKVVAIEPVVYSYYNVFDGSSPSVR